MGLEDLVPLIHLCIRWLVRAEVRTPPVRKALKPCTFGRCQTSDDVVRLDNTILITGIRAVHQCGGLFLSHSHTLRLHLRIEAIRLIVDERRVFIIGCHQGICHGSVVTWGLKGYLLGTDNLGRNVFYRILKGGQMTMTVGFIAVIIQFAIGILVGGISGYYGGTVDILLMRLSEVVGSLPFIPLALILSALIGNKVSDVGRIIMIMLILGFLGWTGIAGLVRAQVLAERNKEFVVAAKALGVREKNIIFRHIVPNVMTIIIVQATISFATCMLTESGLSFLGFGVAEPIPSWGNMLNNCRSSEVISQYWWRWVFPSVVLGLCTVSINLFGDGLRRAVDPKANER